MDLSNDISVLKALVVQLLARVESLVNILAILTPYSG